MKKERISAASLAQIVIDDKYLVGLNKRSLTKGNKIYTPFGGALEFHEEAKSFLDSLDVEYEKGNDLRFLMDCAKVPTFEKWFYTQKDRESSPLRELTEELVEEENVFTDLNSKCVNLTYLTTTQERAITNRPGQEGQMTQRFLEIYAAEFTTSHAKQIEKALAQNDSRLALVTANEISNLRTESGIELGSNCTPLLYGKEDK